MIETGSQKVYGTVRLLEQQPGAQEFVEFSAPDGLTTSYTLVFPDELPAAGAVFYVEAYADSEVRLNWFYAGTDTARVYRRSFTDSDLELGVLTAFHGLTVESATVQVWNNSGEAELLENQTSVVFRPAIPQYAQATCILQKYLHTALNQEHSDIKQKMKEAARDTRILLKTMDGTPNEKGCISNGN